MKKSTILIQENNAILMIQIVGKNRQLTRYYNGITHGQLTSGLQDSLRMHPRSIRELHVFLVSLRYQTKYLSIRQTVAKGESAKTHFSYNRVRNKSIR